MSIGMNEKFLSDIKMNDELYYESLINELESFLEKELSKSEAEIDEFFIDECCVAIEYLRSVKDGEETETYETIVDIEKMIKGRHKRERRIYVGSAACAAVAVLCAVISLKSADANEQNHLRPYESSGNSYEKTEVKGSGSDTEESETIEYSHTTNDILSIDPVSTTEQTVTDNVIPSVTEPIAMIYKMELLLAPGGSLIVSDESQIETVLANSFIVVTYSDESVDYVSIDKCQVEIGTRNENGKVKVTITYKNMRTDIYVTIETTEE